MESNKDIGWYLDIDYDAFSFSMDTTDVGIVLLPLCLSQCRLAAAQNIQGRNACIKLPTLAYHDVSSHC